MKKMMGFLALTAVLFCGCNYSPTSPSNIYGWNIEYPDSSGAIWRLGSKQRILLSFDNLKSIRAKFTVISSGGASTLIAERSYPATRSDNPEYQGFDWFVGDDSNGQSAVGAGVYSLKVCIATSSGISDRAISNCLERGNITITQ